MEGFENRKHVRSVTPFEGLIIASDLSVQSLIINVSMTGLLCVCDTRMPETLKVTMTLEFPTAQFQPVEVEGRVVRCFEDDDFPGQFLVGMEFLDLSQKDLDVISVYVNHDHPDLV